MELKLYLQMLQKGWWLVVLGALSGLVASLLISYFAVPQYQATARFFVSPSATLTTTSEVVNSLNTLDRESVIATYVEVMNSDRIFNDSLAFMQIDPLIMEDYIVTAVVLPSSSVLELTVTGPNPQIVAELANVIGNQTIQFAASINLIFDMNFLDVAVPPTEPFSPQPLRNAGLSLGFGALLGAMLAIVGEQVRTPLEIFSQYLRMDSASGVYNGRHFRRLLEQEINEHPDASLAVGVIELEGLKDMLEVLPSAGQEQLLHTIGRTLGKELRGTDIVGRWNEICFGIILPDTSSGAASRTLERIYEALSVPVGLSRYDVTVSLAPHIGAAVYSNRITVPELLEKVDGSLDQARRGTRNELPVYLWDLKNPFWEQNQNK